MESEALYAFSRVARIEDENSDSMMSKEELNFCIELVRSELNRLLTWDSKIVDFTAVITVSKVLDKLILKYIQAN